MSCVAVGLACGRSSSSGGHWSRAPSPLNPTKWSNDWRPSTTILFQENHHSQPVEAYSTGGFLLDAACCLLPGLIGRVSSGLAKSLVSDSHHQRSMFLHSTPTEHADLSERETKHPYGTVSLVLQWLPVLPIQRRMLRHAFSSF